MRDEVVVSDLMTRTSWRPAKSRKWAHDLGFSRTDATLIATAISEIARNIWCTPGAARYR